MFTDLVGSTALLTRLGEDAFRAVRVEHDRLLTDAVVRNKGEVVKHGGDGIMAAFTSASDAVTAACDLQAAIDLHNRRNEPLGVRVGISVGDVEADDGDYFGTPVVEAARLCAAADGGQILVSDFVRGLCGSRGGHEFHDAGARELAGLPAPVSAWTVGWTPHAEAARALPAQLRYETPFVGRRSDRNELDQVWARAVVGDTVAVFVAGEPGIGKTRLVAELAATAYDTGALVLFGRCDEDLGGPYQPFVEAIRRHAQTDDDMLDQLLPRDADALAQMIPDLADRLGRTDTADLDPETARERIFDAVAAWLRAASRDRPVLLVLDDVHWAARSTLLMLRHVVRAEIGNTLLAATYRTTDLDRTHPLAELLADFRREPNVTRIGLDGLDAHDVADFMQAVAGHDLDAPGRSLATQLAHDTGGNPFFVTAVLANLVESGALQRGADDRWAAAGDPMAMEIPEGVRDVVGQRLTRLGPDANRVLHHAAVIGTEFELELLETLPGLDVDPLETVEAATATGLVRDLGAGRYGFAHAIVRRTLLDEITSARLMRIHRDIHTVLTNRPPAATLLEDVARHALAAAPLVDTATAVHSALAATDDALARAAWEEGITITERALDVIANDPDDALRYEVLHRLRVCRIARAETRASLELTSELVAISRQLNDPYRLERAITSAQSDALDGDPQLFALAESVLQECGETPSVLRSVAAAIITIGRAQGLLPGEPTEMTAIHDAHDEISVPALGHIASAQAWAAWGWPDLALYDAAIAAMDRVPFGHPMTRVGTLEAMRALRARRAGDTEGVAVALAQLRQSAAANRYNMNFAAVAQAEIVDRLFTGTLDGLDELLGGPGSIAVQSRAFRTGDATEQWWLACLLGDADRAFAALDTLGTLVSPLWLGGVTSWTEHLFDRAEGGTPIDPARATTAIRSATHTWTFPGQLYIVGDVAVWSGETALATVARDRLVPYDGQFLLAGPSLVPGSAAASLAHLEAFLGEHDAADAHYREAIAFEEQAGARTLLARTLYRYGRFTGDHAHTDRAWALAREIGLGEAYLTR